MNASTPRQQQAYEAIHQLRLFEKLAHYTPVLCGTFPIGIDIEGSDLDIIMEAAQLEVFEQEVREMYGGMRRFRLKTKVIREQSVVKANFFYAGFEFELFAQHKPVVEQYAYLHMMIEKQVLEKMPAMREKVMMLKESGYKTEPAFCKVLGLRGDPYEALLAFGRREGMIE
ncbi:DUF4269 domain-containing protein [Shouchella shacheensis]|uniref:DUF4269 domain-containing protein n=1 Tax=Shouchella shacheensis TaxID=1649580 RepID=UPI00073FFEBC|nr:DUF4269 domain-containing protein [Shouchella shacheensis]